MIRPRKRRIVSIAFTGTDKHNEAAWCGANGIPLDAPPLLKAQLRELECLHDPVLERKVARAIHELRQQRATAPRIRRTVVRTAHVRRAARAHRRTVRAGARRAAASSASAGDGSDGEPPPASSIVARRIRGGAV